MTKTFFFPILFLFFAASLAAETFRLEDDKLCVEFDSTGRLVRLENKTSENGNVIAESDIGLFRMVCRKGDNWENAAWPDKQEYRVSKHGDTIRIVVEKVKTRETPNELTLTMNVTLKDGTLTFGAEIDNREPDLTVVEFQYPRVGMIKSLGGGRKTDLLWPVQMGRRYKNFGTGQEFNETYPGGFSTGLSMQWAMLTDEEETFYISGRDSEFYSTTIRARGRNGAAFDFTRYAFVKPKTRWTSPDTVVRLYTGSWRRAADEYRAWASTWRPVREKPDWVRDMLGFFLVINKQQYGDEMWPYDTLPKLYEIAQSHGFDTLGLFGWYEGGHDNTYPDLEVGKTLGGAESLRENIKKVRDAGGNVTLYVQGNLIDIATDYYKKHGHKVEGKTRWGTPYFETHGKSNESEFLRFYTCKYFSTACPSCTEWQDLMVKYVDWIHGLGASGILYDQVGGMPPRPCFNDEHPHPKGNPGLSFAPGRNVLLGKIRDRTREVGKDFGFVSEHINDVYSQHADMLHGMHFSPGGVNCPELFRYVYPDTIVTVRNPAPHISSAFTNLAATYGVPMEMEIRYRSDMDHVLDDRSPDQRNYARKVAELRKKYRDPFAQGRFVDEEPLKNGNPNTICKAFESGNRLGAVLWNPTQQPQKALLDVPGYRLVETAQPEFPDPKTSLPETIPISRIVFALYEKE